MVLKDEEMLKQKWRGFLGGLEGRDEGREERSGSWQDIEERGKMVKTLLTNYIKATNILGLGYLKLENAMQIDT